MNQSFVIALIAGSLVAQGPGGAQRPVPGQPTGAPPVTSTPNPGAPKSQPKTNQQGRLAPPETQRATVSSLPVPSSPAAHSRVSRGAILAVERSINERVERLWTDNPFVLLGATRGVYLEGYGAVFTAEINLATGPTMIMRSGVTKNEIVAHRNKKIQRLPEIRAAMKQMLADAAASLDTVPNEENIVLAAHFSRYPWEDVSGLPTQLIVQGQKKKLIEAKLAGGAALDTVIRMEEL